MILVMKEKYGFNLDWFLCTYNICKYPKNFMNADDKDKLFLQETYMNYYDNYKGFIDIVCKKFNLDKKKKKFLEVEKKCLKCKNKYPFTYDSFLYVFDNETKTDITYELCFDCLVNIQKTKCNTCESVINEPYETIVIRNINSNDQYCSKCFKKFKIKNYTVL